MKILCVLGTRPEAIKLAPVIRALRTRATVHRVGLGARVPTVHSTDGLPITVKVCVTAQHRHMLDQVLGLFAIAPDYDLNVMHDHQTPTQVAAVVLAGLEPILAEEHPDWMVVQGDTTTVAAASLGAFYAHVKVGHVEAGLRTYDKWQPFPEEMNRRVASVIADWHFAPTERARQNLVREGVPPHQVLVTGNPVIDALQWVAALPPTPEVDDLLHRVEIDARVEAWHTTSSTARHALKAHASPVLLLVTAHRRENVGAPLEQICAALRTIAKRYDGAVQIVYPVHPNPHVWEPVHRLLGHVPHITLTPPLEYLLLIHLMKRAALVLTDSGGLQEEAPSLGMPVLVLRAVTERPEGVDAGAVRVIGVDRDRIVAETVHLLEDRDAYDVMARAVNPYGDGQASERIVRALLGTDTSD